MDFQSGRRRKNSFSDEDDVREPIKVSRMWMNEAADLDGLQANTFKPVMADHHMRLQPRVDNATPSALSLQQRAMAAIALQEIRSFDPAKHIFPQRQHPQLLAQQPNSGMKYPQQQHMAPSLIPQGPLLDRYGGSAAPQNSVPALGDPPSPKIGANMSPQSIYPMQGMPIARQQPNGLLMVDPSQSVNGKQPSRSWYSSPMVEPPMMAPMRPPMGNMFPPDFQDMENRGAILQYQTTHDQQQQIQHEPGTSAESNAALNGYQGSSSAQVGVNLPKASTSNSCLGRISSEQYQGVDRRVINYASPPENGQVKNAVEAGTEGAQVQQGSAVQIKQSSNRTYTKVYKLGSIGRAVDVARFKTYSELRAELARMFGLEGQLDQKSGWQLVFVDKENDLLLVGDDPWEEFVNSVRGIRILSPSEVSFYTSDERSEAL